MEIFLEWDSMSMDNLEMDQLNHLTLPSSFSTIQPFSSSTEEKDITNGNQKNTYSIQ